MLILLRPAADRVQGPAIPSVLQLAYQAFSNPGEREGRSLQQILAGLELGRINVAARGVGIARPCLEESIAYSQVRKTFGKPICERSRHLRSEAGSRHCIEAA